MAVYQTRVDEDLNALEEKCASQEAPHVHALFRGDFREQEFKVRRHGVWPIGHRKLSSRLLTPTLVDLDVPLATTSRVRRRAHELEEFGVGLDLKKKNHPCNRPHCRKRTPWTSSLQRCAAAHSP